MLRAPRTSAASSASSHVLTCPLPFIGHWTREPIRSSCVLRLLLVRSSQLHTLFSCNTALLLQDYAHPLTRGATQPRTTSRSVSKPNACQVFEVPPRRRLLLASRTFPWWHPLRQHCCCNSSAISTSPSYLPAHTLAATLAVTSVPQHPATNRIPSGTMASPASAAHHQHQLQGLPSISSLTNGLPSSVQQLSPDQQSLTESTRDSGTWPQPQSKRKSLPSLSTMTCTWS